MNTTIEPGNISQYLEKERKEKEDLKNKVRNLENIISQFDIIKNQNKSVGDFFDKLKNDLQDKDKELQNRIRELEEVKRT